MQVAATLGFVLGRRNGQFLRGLRPKEADAIREILVWGRQSLNNKVLQFYGSELENNPDCQMPKKARLAKFDSRAPIPRSVRLKRVVGTT